MVNSPLIRPYFLGGGGIGGGTLDSHPTVCSGGPLLWLDVFFWLSVVWALHQAIIRTIQDPYYPTSISWNVTLY